MHEECDYDCTSSGTFMEASGSSKIRCEEGGIWNNSIPCAGKRLAKIMKFSNSTVELEYVSNILISDYTYIHTYIHTLIQTIECFHEFLFSQAFAIHIRKPA